MASNKQEEAMSMTKANTIEDREVGWMKSYLSELDGATIIGTDAQRDEFGDLWPTLYIELANGESIMVEISADQEGNGGGFLFGLSAPSQR